jgi:hypothetical protein
VDLVGLAGGGLPVYRSIASVPYASRSGVTTVAKPAGTANDDVMVATFFGASATEANIQVTTVPAGWTQVGTTVSQSSEVGFFGKLFVYWKRASGEGTSYDFGHTATISTQATIASYSGVAPTGNPVNVFSQASGISSTATALSISPTVSNTKLIYAGHNWDNSQTLTPPSGMTERFDGIVYNADEDWLSAGATGAKTQTQASSNPWQAYLLALKPEPSGPPSTYTVSAESGSYSFAGTTVTTGRGLISLPGSYTFTGRSVILRKNNAFGLNAISGSYRLTGTAVTLTYHAIVASSGMNVWNGSAWVDKPVKVWTGSAWVQKPVKVWNGSSWI